MSGIRTAQNVMRSERDEEERTRGVLVAVAPGVNDIAAANYRALIVANAPRRQAIRIINATWRWYVLQCSVEIFAQFCPRTKPPTANINRY